MTTLQLKNLPTFMVVTNSYDFMFQDPLSETKSMIQASMVLMNNYEDL
jgi:hypothetical protein